MIKLLSYFASYLYLWFVCWVFLKKFQLYNFFSSPIIRSFSLCLEPACRQKVDETFNSLRWMKHLVVALLLLPSTHDPIALASCEEDRGWGRKKIVLEVRYFLCSFSLRTADFCSLGYISVSWALCFSIKRFPLVLGRVCSQGTWYSLTEQYWCPVLSAQAIA